MNELSAIIVGANTVTLVFGGALSVYAYRAYTRTRSAALKALTIGFGLITLGTLLSGLLHQFTDVSLLFSTAIHSVSVAVGLLVMAYSLQSTGAGSTSIRYTTK